MKERVCYYSKYDGSIGHYLELAEKRIYKFNQGDIPTDLEGVIELYQIKQYFENNCRLLKWSDADFNQLKDVTTSFNTVIVECFKAINPINIVDEYNNLEWGYHQAFWEIIDKFKLYQLIDSTSINSIIMSDVNSLRLILHVKGLVDKYGQVIREILIDNKYSAQIILDKYVGNRDSLTDREIYLPTCLTQRDKEDIIIDFLEGDDHNLNYVRLVTQVKNSAQFSLSPKTRLKAERLEKKLNDELLKDHRTSIIHTQEGLQLVEDAKPLDIEYDAEGFPIFKYSIPYIQSCDNTHRVTNCISLFGWMNRNVLLDLINKRTEVNTLESVMMDTGRNSYPVYTVFRQKNNRAYYQTFLYSKALERLGSSFENELKLYYEGRLHEEYDYPGLAINLPSLGDTWLNKCRILFPELDAIVKQYNTFVEEDEIDPELIRLAPPLKMTNGKSLLVNKYFEIKEGENEIWRVLKDLFASASMLAYVKPHKEKHYHSLIYLLENEIVAYDDYEDYQKREIDYLISIGVISVDAMGNVIIEDKPRVAVLKSLWEYNVCSYWHYDEEERIALDDMLTKGWLKIDDHLLSKPERDYFSYYLDNSEFTNGYAYRNHYAHGSTPSADDESAHATAYLIFLQLLAILILKMEDDLWLARKVFVIGINNINKNEV
ncbi:MAG: hypothetical protein H6Q12_1184 [Bacteroidetes bacterium]|nr:hypothetical protein [Bacteroidota bacterium]